MVKLNKHNVKLFARKQPTDRKEQATEVTRSEKFVDCREMLQECKEMYDHLYEFRSRAMRAFNYVYGRQWEDKIIDPEGYFVGDTIKEEDYIKRQGKVPLKYNIMSKSLKSIVGLYRQNKVEPVAIAHDRDEQKLGEMMTVVMQYAYDVNRVFDMNVNMLKDAFCSGLCVRSCYFRNNDERQMKDVFIQNESPFMIFFNSDVQDPLMRDLSTIGAIRDMNFKDLVQTFARSRADVQLLENEYKSIQRKYIQGLDAFSRSRFGVESDFLVPREPNKCRVYEVWRKESEACYYCHDTAIGTEEYRPIDELDDILAENQRRRQEMISLGYSPESASLIEYGSGQEPDDHKIYFRQYWRYYYLTPNGNCICDGESRFEHGSHPFTIQAFPMVNGEIHSPAEDLIDIQRVINRTLSQIDFIRQNSAKGVLMCPIDAVPDDMSPRQFASAYTRNGGVLFYKPNATGVVPQQIKSNSVVAGDLEVVRLYMQLNDEISGINGALQGQTPSSGTPASRYAQEAQNSATNLADFLGWFGGVVRSFDYKMMKTIQQYYDDKRYIPIVGKSFSEESRWYNPEKVRQCEFDITISEATSTPAYRMAAEDTLFQALQSGFIDFKSYLEASSAPFADKMLEVINRNETRNQEKQAEMQQQQAALQAQQAPQAAAGQPMVQQQ